MSDVPLPSSDNINAVYNNVISGDAEQSLLIIERWIQGYGMNPTLLQLKGIALHKLGRCNDAALIFKWILKSNPKNGDVCNNLANLYMDIGQYSIAEKYYLRAIDNATNTNEALNNYTINCVKAKSYYNLIGLVNKYQLKKSKSFALLTNIGNLYQKKFEFRKSIFWYILGLRCNVTVKGIYGLSRSYRMLGEISLALSNLKSGLGKFPNSIDLLYLYALCFFDEGNFSESRSILYKIIGLSPNFILAHESLAELDWQESKIETFAESYLPVITDSNDHDVIASYLLVLIKSRLLCKADVIVNAIDGPVNSSSLKYALANYFREIEDYNNSKQKYRDLLVCEDNVEYGLELVEVHIRCNELENAKELVQNILKADKYNQLAIAYQNYLWLKSGSHNIYNKLCDFERFVKTYTIDFPDDYSSLESFLDSISCYLKSIHSLRREPLTQSLKNGTQSSGRLFLSDNKAIVDLKKMLSQCVQDYLFSLPVDPDHPFLSRNVGSFNFSGSWSISQSEGGYHVTHVHPEGWISSAFYVSTIGCGDCATENEKFPSGSILFGRSPFESLSADSVRKVIIPKPGMVVFFPSYMWHETVPVRSVNGKVERLTTPFDIVPGFEYEN